MGLLNVNFFEKHGWVLLLIGIGLLFRYELLRRSTFDKKERAKKILYEISVIIFITIIWSQNPIDDGNIFNLLVKVPLLVGYTFYVLVKKMPKCGYSESMLLCVNGFMVTALSFMPFPENIGFIVLIIVGSIFVTKYWFGEKKSDFLEILLLCGESLLISLYVFFKKVSEPIEITMIVLYIESFIFMSNCFIKYFLVWICKEDTEDYWNKLMGID